MNEKVEMEESLTIKSLAEADRPREKMMQKGAEALSDAELLAILIGSGTAKESAVTLSQRILKHYDNDLNALARVSLKELMATFKGIGEAKALSIMSALEIGRRRRTAEVRKLKQIHSSADLYEYFSTIADLQHEEFHALALGTTNKIIASQRICQGGINQTLVDVRVLMKFVLENSATTLAVCHNHPSGSLKPSRQDIELTEKIQKACGLMDVRFLDHIIVTDVNYFSFSDENLI